MKKKKKLLCLFLITMFLLLPSKVYAVQNCDLNVSNITNNSAKLIWVRKEREPNNVTVYKSDASYSVGTGLILSDDWDYELYDGELTSNDTDDDTDVKTVFCKDSLKILIHKYWMWIIVLSPILLILLISFDIVKAVISNDADAIKKSGSTAIKRTVAVVILLFTPFLLKLIFSLFGLEEYICF